ncbi:MAG: NADPH-dependent assimilatory sulfite reductase hemoprotein subunit [Gemmataceae bacterium]
MATDATKLSPVETFKEESQYLRGTLAQELAAESDHFEEGDKQLLKFHGSYQQDDREARAKRRKEGLGKYYMFMVRCKIPGGVLTDKQYLAMDGIAQRFAKGTMRLTSRQSIQLHWILKSELQETIKSINDEMVTTLGGCGDVNRNVMVSPAPLADEGIHSQLQALGQELAERFAPQTQAYHEIWLNGKQVETDTNNNKSDHEPIYGKVYLPRKFKIGIALPENNIVDIYSQDLGLLAVVEGKKIVGYNVLVGGGMGRTTGKDETFPQISKPICYVPVEEVTKAAEAVIKIFRDHGNRQNRKRARIKYVVHDWGIEKFREVMAEYMGKSIELPKDVEVTDFDLSLGWQPQGDGKYWYGISIANGRIKDEGDFQLMSAIRKIVRKLKPEVRLTPMQDILLCNLDAGMKPEVEKILKKHNVPLPNKLSKAQTFSMACPAIPTCGLAISESERALPNVIKELDAELTTLGLNKDTISVRMTGCPNGCVRPYQSDIGLVGRSGNKYTLLVGGHTNGHRLNFILFDLVPIDEIVPLLSPIFRAFKKDRQEKETFGDYCQRLGVERLHKLLAKELDQMGEAERKKRIPEKSEIAPEFSRTPLPVMAAGTPAPTPLKVSSNGKNEAKAKPAPQPENPKGVDDGLPEQNRPENAKDSDDSLPPGRTAPPVGEERPRDSGPDTTNRPRSTPKPETKPTTEAPQAFMESETFLVGETGEELKDYTIHYAGDGTVRETVVYFYQSGRAAQSEPDEPLVRTESFVGQVDPAKLNQARKLSEVHHVGEHGHERKDKCVEYGKNGKVKRTVVYLYEDGKRAHEVPTKAAIRREKVYLGEVK